MKNYLKSNLNIVLLTLLSLLIFIFFFVISYLTPLAGDDWGYAINGIMQNPFITAFEFYQSWSGRFFSELYGFVITPYKNIWNFLNAFLFSGIFILSISLSLRKNVWTGALLLIFLMLSVKDELRMETYTWLMGTTYVIPLFLALIFLKLNLNQVETNQKYSVIRSIASCFILFYIGLSMENIAIVMLISTIVFNVFVYIKEHRVIPILLVYTFISTISLILLRSSPGASARLLRDHPEWISMSIFDQIIQNYPNFIRYTFIEHRILILTLSTVFFIKIATVIIKSRKIDFKDFFLLSIFLIASLSTFSLQLSTRIKSVNWSIFTNHNSLFNTFFWILFTIALFTSIILYFDKKLSLQMSFFLLIAGASNGVMMLSPIFGYRSTLYTVYLLFILTLFVFDTFQFSKFKQLGFSLLLLLLIIFESRGLLYKYQLVNRVNRLRVSEIQYYQDNPDSTEAWLIRFPIYTIHSADIEEWDEYHMEVFKKYYNLNMDMKIYFYAPESSYEEFLSQKGW